MTTIDRKNVWIRLGGNAKNLKAGGKEGWRLFISDRPFEGAPKNDEILVVDWKPAGNATGANFIPGTFIASGQSAEQPVLVAWIDMFGDIKIDEDRVAHINLKGV